MKAIYTLCLVSCFLAASMSSALAGEEAATPVSPLERIYRLGNDLFDQYVPENMREELYFPNPEDWRIFWNDIERILASHSLEDAAAWLPAVQVALKYLDFDEEAAPLVAWLRQQLDYFRMAGDAMSIPPSVHKIEPAPPVKPHAAPDPNRHAMIRSLAEWEKRLRNRPPPKDSDALSGLLKNIFNEEGLAPQWIWIAEVESSMNPAAISPAGAAGLFQFMPETAVRFGLQLTPQDERYSPEMSARAAARYLRFLYDRFECWPLSLAAYNSGEGRVGRLLAQRGKTSFEDIADDLPLETQMYVPKVLATVKLRETVDPLTLPPPTRKP